MLVAPNGAVYGPDGKEAFNADGGMKAVDAKFSAIESEFCNFVGGWRGLENALGIESPLPLVVENAPQLKAPEEGTSINPSNSDKLGPAKHQTASKTQPWKQVGRSGTEISLKLAIVSAVPTKNAQVASLISLCSCALFALVQPKVFHLFSQRR